MSRLKFRQWSPKHNRFFYWGHKINSHGNPVESPEWTGPKMEHEKGSIVDVDQSEQFTGLCDRNGFEIYDGSIVKCKTVQSYNIHRVYEIVGDINWDDADLCWYILPKKNRWSIVYLKIYHVDHVEVIGNIHQNPELL